MNLKKQLVTFCSPEDTPDFDGLVHYKNPRFFDPNANVPSYVTHFFTKDEKIRQKYLEAGLEELKVEEKHEEVVEPEKEEESVDIENMSWPELRSYACSLTEEPVKNKKDAIRLIKEHLEQ